MENMGNEIGKLFEVLDKRTRMKQEGPNGFYAPKDKGQEEPEKLNKMLLHRSRTPYSLLEIV